MSDHADDIVSMMFHPTLMVRDLEAARHWFRRVFGRSDTTWRERWNTDLFDADYPVDYSFFVHLADTVLDVLSPREVTRGSLSGQQRWDLNEQRLSCLGWYCNDLVDAVRHVADFGIRCHGQDDELIAPGCRPVTKMADDVLVAFTVPEDAGLRYEFFELGERHRAFYSVKGDPRLAPGWSLPDPAANDPLGLVRCSHHTIATASPDRALHLYRDALGGSVLGELYNAELDADSIFVRLRGSTLEFANPRAGSVHKPSVSNGLDSYVGMTFTVVSLEMLANHLKASGCAHHWLNRSVVVVDADEGFGATWRFIEQA